MLVTWMLNNSLEHINKLSVIPLTFAIYFALVGIVLKSHIMLFCIAIVIHDFN